MAEKGEATDVVSMMAKLTTAVERAGEITSKAKVVCEIVTDVTEQSHKTLMELTREAANIASGEVNEFHNAMRETEAAGEPLKDRCLELEGKWNSIETYICRKYTAKQKELGKSDVQECIKLFQLMLECAATCDSRYNEFRKNLHHAIDVGTRLAERSRVAAEDAKFRASNTRAVGYGATGLLGAAALGFLTVATGGLALAGAAAVGALAAGMYTNDRAGRLDKLATEFDNLRGKLNDSLRDLNKLGDSITGLFKVTEKMAESMQIALNIFKEHERVRQENEERMLMNEKFEQENEDLRKQIEALKVEEQKRQELGEQENSKLAKKTEELEKRLQELEAGKKKKQKGGAKCRNM